VRITNVRLTGVWITGTECIHEVHTLLKLQHFTSKIFVALSFRNQHDLTLPELTSPNQPYQSQLNTLTKLPSHPGSLKRVPDPTFGHSSQ